MSNGWVKARRSNSSGNCFEFKVVQFDNIHDGIAVRNSRFPDQVLPVFTMEEFAAMLDGVRRGEFDELLDAKADVG